MKRFPRVAYWIAGAILACAGAVGARLSEIFPLQERIPIWLAGAGVVFLGLCVVSLGTRAYLDSDAEDVKQPEEGSESRQDSGKSPERKDDGAGEGNRTLA
ncbi:MAG: hypothetical protein HWD60_04310 [Defluviicoccus sp.]|nr:MAG: hypothetical protein HWD60_04310 [Defluviicoccus sp.]